jgi:hypothetical protein
MSIWYWHFVDVVWIFLFLMLYWWGNSTDDLIFLMKFAMPTKLEPLSNEPIPLRKLAMEGFFI